MRTRTSLTIVALLMVLLGSLPIQAETVRELLNLYDKNRDGILDKKEFDEALKANGIRVVTPAGVKRAARAQELFNVAAKKYPDTELRYKKRAAQAAFLTNPPPEVSKHRALSLRRSLPAAQAYDALTTYEKFIVRRAYGDLPAAGVDADTALAETSDPVTTFLENNFRIRNKMEGISGEAVSDGPAKFAWTRSKGEDAFYTIDVALLYTPSWLNWRWDALETDKEENLRLQGWIFGGKIRPAFEAHVSTQEGSARNELKYSFPIEGRFKYFPGGEANKRTVALPSEDLPFVSANHFSLAPVYVTDRVASVRSWGVDALYEPSIPYLNLNHDDSRRLFGLSWLEGSMKGGIGFAFREYEQGRPAAMLDNDYGAFVGHIEGGLTFGGRIKFAADYSASSGLWGEMHTHSFFEASAEVLVDKKNHFTVGFSYLYGETEPTFEKVDTFTGWVGVKF